VICTHRQLSAEQVRAFSEGDLYAGFGPGFEAGQAHVRTPAIQNARCCWWTGCSISIHRAALGSGYLRAVTPIRPDDWFFAGHFKNDPCMPGTLMFEGCLQMMAIYLAGLGYTLFAMAGVSSPCRGDVPAAVSRSGGPTSKELVCEMFVEEVHDARCPCVCGSTRHSRRLKAFHARRVGLRLVPDWPLSSHQSFCAKPRCPRPWPR